MSSVETPGYRGLSPLARGTRRINSQVQRPARFIPAGAGNTGVPHAEHLPEPVYPRSRGEHSASSLVSHRIRGLSPLARGTQVLIQHGGGTERFIPAGAGNTRWFSALALSGAVYPRWRGEHEQMALDRQTIGGLSPLARGTLVSPPHRKRWCRFIPAGAGNTLSVTHSSNYQPVYPRWRGEHKPLRAITEPRLGLSPLARGTPDGNSL